MSPRTWRLDFDINDVEDCPTHTVSNNTTTTEAETEELLGQESNRESVSSRELSTRTDSEYIEEFVEEVMNVFQSNTPEFSCAFSSPVPWKVFIDIQLARKSNKDQSIFDRCIFEALNEAVTDTYRTCNRVLSTNRHTEDEEDLCIPLPPDQEWVMDVKNKVLRAVNHRSLHADAIGTILAQDAFYFQNSVMDLRDELEEVQRDQLDAI